MTCKCQTKAYKKWKKRMQKVKDAWYDAQPGSDYYDRNGGSW